MYIHMCDKEDWPISEEEFNKLMKFTDVLILERQMYIQKTKLILDLFDLVLNYNPKADEKIRNEYKSNVYDKINLVRKTILNG